MPAFGKRSLGFLEQADESLVVLAHEALFVGMDFAVTEAHRGKEDQEVYFHKGLTKVHWPDSEHNKLPSRAIHFVPWPVDWKDLSRFYHLAGIVRCAANNLRTDIRWGGDWDGDFDLRDQTFMDLAHYELL